MQSLPTASMTAGLKNKSFLYCFDAYFCLILHSVPFLMSSVRKMA